MASEVAFPAGPIGLRAVRRWLWPILVAGQVLFSVFLLRQWLNAGTYRLYLDKQAAPVLGAVPQAREKFVLRGGRVEPQILSSESERLAFPIAFPWPT